MASDRRQRRTSPPSAAAASSPSLPADLVPAIAACLKTLEDFFALRAACRSYRALLPPCRSTLASQPPLLLLTTFPSFSEALFHLRLRRLLRFRLPWGHPSSRQTLFFSHGFLVTITTKVSSSRNYLLLLHLFSGQRLRLPKAPAPFRRVVLSVDLLTVLFTPRSPTVQYCRSGDALWRVASIDATQVLQDLFFLNGTLYALLGESCRLAVVHLLENSLELSFLGGESDDDLSRRPDTTFMLGECGGEVLLICEDVDIVAYRAYRWEFGKGKWARVTSLGGRTIFLGYDGFAACVGPGCPGIRGDCIYAARELSGEWCEYSLVDGTCDFHYAEYPGAPPRNNSFICAPVWVFPSLC